MASCNVSSIPGDKGLSCLFVCICVCVCGDFHCVFPQRVHVHVPPSLAGYGVTFDNWMARGLGLIDTIYTCVSTLTCEDVGVPASIWLSCVFDDVQCMLAILTLVPWYLKSFKRELQLL